MKTYVNIVLRYDAESFSHLALFPPMFNFLCYRQVLKMLQILVNCLLIFFTYKELAEWSSAHCFFLLRGAFYASQKSLLFPKGSIVSG